MKRALFFVALCSFLTLTGACGHRGSPSPPLPRIPAAPRDAEWRQRGDRIEVSARYPLRTLEGAPLRAPVRPVALVLAVRGGDTSGWDGPARETEFERGAMRVPLAPFEDGARTRDVERIDALPLDKLPPATFVLAAALGDKRSRSFASPRIPFAPLRPGLRGVPALAASPEETGVRLRWTAPEDARAKAVRIYRARGAEPFAWRPWRTAPAGAKELFDDEARYGDDLRYAATYGAEEKQDPPVESEPGAAATVAYRDVFPPRPPQQVDAAPETRRVRVFWYPGGSADEAKAIVERQLEGKDAWVEVGAVETPESFFVDADAESGRRRYRVIAVDKAGNRAAPAGPTDWVAPRP